MTKILPHRGYLLIEVLKPERKTKAGVILPENVNEEPMYGKVLEIGKPWLKEGGVVEEAPSFIITDEEGNPQKLRKLQKGDTIIFKRYTQEELNETTGDENRIAFLNFDSIRGLELEEEKENADGK